MVYGATDEDTAYAETIAPQTQAATAATFATTLPARLVDLDRLPMVPSLFDDSPRRSATVHPSAYSRASGTRSAPRSSVTIASTSTTFPLRSSPSTSGTCFAMLRAVR
jgi:hypothetical protein